MIIPAIDIRGGKCVRLLHGNFNDETTYPFDPVELAERYSSSGAKCIHVVDLDAAKSGSSENAEVIAGMVAASSIPVQVGGGVRSASTAHEWLSRGVHRVVLGSVAMKQPDLVIELINSFGSDHVCVALDVRPNGTGYELTAEGWLEKVSTPLEKLMDFYVKYDTSHVLMTDVSRDGAMTGPNLELYRHIAAEYPTIDLQASGGVRSSQDVCDLKDVGASAAIVGKALLTGAITLGEALEC